MNKATLLTLQEEIAELERLLSNKKQRLEEVQYSLFEQAAKPAENLGINNNSPPETKITLFRSLFKGREDIYAKLMKLRFLFDCIVRLSSRTE